MPIAENVSRDAYFAGLFDGEGSVGIYKVSNGQGGNDKKFYAVRLSIVGTYRPMIEAAYKYFGCGLFTTQKRQAIGNTPRGGYSVTKQDGAKLCKQGWKWTVTDRRGCRMVLEAILPYLYEKREQVEIVLAFIDGEIDGEVAHDTCKAAKRFSFSADGFDQYKERRSENWRSNRSKLTDEQAADIKKMAKGEANKLALARTLAPQYGMKVGGMYAVVLNQSYKSVQV